MILHPDPLVVLDECVWKKIAAGMKRRGYDVQTVPELLHSGVKDPDLLAALGRLPRPVAFVSKDRAMLDEHDDALAASGIALAILDLGDAANTAADPYVQADTVHKHLHRIAARRPGSRWRYTLRSRLPVRRLA